MIVDAQEDEQERDDGAAADRAHQAANSEQSSRDVAWSANMSGGTARTATWLTDVVRRGIHGCHDDGLDLQNIGHFNRPVDS